MPMTSTDGELVVLDESESDEPIYVTKDPQYYKNYMKRRYDTLKSNPEEYKKYLDKKREYYQQVGKAKMIQRKLEKAKLVLEQQEARKMYCDVNEIE